ncbi:tetratricopeptide repeat protein, partial [Desulfosarcina sp. OttesenSCG-928-A07]|nr:tetratricopeptide repeat protein [Desulfosarcina sp. OttesenSCG-928-A07]
MTKKNKKASETSAQDTVKQLFDSGDIDAAWEKIRARLKISPRDVWFLSEAGRICRQKGQLEEAKQYFRRALVLQPHDAGILNRMGLTFFDQGDFPEAEKYYRRALSVISGYTACHNNYGILLHKLDRHREAAIQYELVLQHDPNYLEARYGLSSVLAHLLDLDGAETHLRRILKQAPNDTRSQTALGMVLLQKGNFKDGWDLYRGRYATNNPNQFVFLPKINRPYWKGESLAGKSILVWHEQGHGDNIQFCRYISRLKAEKSAQAVYMTCRTELYPLLHHLPGVDKVIIPNKGANLPDQLDYWTVLLDLPRYFLDSDKPFGVMPPYLEADAERLAHWRLEPDTEHPITVGVVWKGTPKHNNDRHRSLKSLSVLKPLWNIPGIRWISLQKGPGEEEALNPASDQPILAMGHRVETFADTAALMAQMDLVITVDTSTAHLAGALNIPCWVMIPFISKDWRWLKDHDDSPWYPSMRLFHRKPDTEWDETVLRIRAALEEWTTSRQNTRTLAQKNLPPEASTQQTVKELLGAGRTYRRTGRVAEAKDCYGRALALQPHNAEILEDLGLTFFNQGDFTEAEKYYLRALDLLTGYTICLHNYCVLLQHTDRHREAALLYEQALCQNPDHTEAHYDLGVALLYLQDLDGTETHMRRVLEKTPNDVRAQTAMGMVLLQKGEFAEGWGWYRARYSPDNPLWSVTLPKTNQPYWKGESLAGKNIMVCMEQGFGDNLQFCRYVSRLKTEKGAQTVYMICKPDLYPLLRRIPDVNWTVVGKDAPFSISGIDCWVMLLDLPRHFLDRDDPFGVMPPYLQADEESVERWQLVPDSRNPLTVGVVWRGASTHNNDRYRSLENLSVLKPLWTVPGIRWVSLQKGPGENEALSTDTDQPIMALGHQLETFDDTAALMAQMDLVITVDTSVAHLAGAMDIPCWVMLPAILADWRWLRNRDDSPWYPSMRLFRQQPDAGWEETVLQILEALKTWARYKPDNNRRNTAGETGETSFSVASAQETVRALLESGQTDAALAKICSLLEAAPDDVWLLQQAGQLCRQNNRQEEAKNYYERARVLQPDNGETLYGLGLVHFYQGNFAEAEKYYRQALAFSPDHTMCLHNYGALLSRSGRHKEAALLYEQALHNDPGFVESRFGLGVSLKSLQELEGAERCLQEVLQQIPNDPRVQCTLGMVWLQKGKFAEGWSLYRGRYAPENPHRFTTLPKTTQPCWQGENLEGKSILIYAEQGFGDSIQFCRYATRLKKEKGAHAVYMTCQPELYPLLAHLPDIDRIVPVSKGNNSMEEADCWAMLLDLPFHFLDSNDPFGVAPPYLQADAESMAQWRLRPDPQHLLAVGVAWKGRPTHNNDRNRSLGSLAVLKPLWSVPGIRWISLQKGPGENEALNADTDQPIHAMGHRLKNFTDTAALISHLDLVIAVDTSVVHLAGALNIPSWVMIPSVAPDWRWLENRNDSPWYPSMRLFRQQPDAGWEETVLRIRGAL